MEIEKPVFVIGVPRSGTTVVFEALAAHPDVAWFSQYVNRFPGVPAVALLSRLADLSSAFRKSVERSDQARSALEKLRVGPVEAYDLYEKCCGEKFRYDFLLGVRATEAERNRLRRVVEGCLRYQGKPRFAAKITGPGRIGYLSSVFEGVRFVHVVRDGRAVVRSLMRVPFWRERARMREPAWRGGLSEGDLELWRRHDHSPLALAALQWRACLEHSRAEARALGPGRYREVRYEDFVRLPHDVLDEILEFCELARSRRLHEFLERRFDLRDMNYQWKEDFSAGEARLLESLIGECLDALDAPREGEAEGTRAGYQFLRTPPSAG